MTNLRNIGISAHIDSGKTTLAERMLYYCGNIHQMREVRGGDGGATMDSSPIERARGITIQSAVARLAWRDCKINMIDTPGHVDFSVEVERSLRVLDGAVFVLCGVGGVQSQTITVDRQMHRHRVPRIAFINKMDRIGADPQRVVNQMRDRLGTAAVLLQIPIGLGQDFCGVIDLIAMQAVYFDGPFGEHVRRAPIPQWMVADAQRAQTTMLESLAMFDERLMQMLFAESFDNIQPELQRVIRAATLARQLTPVLVGSAVRNIGVQELLDAIAMFLPAPHERKVFAINRSEMVIGPDSELPRVQLSSGADRPLVAMAFKTVEESFGQLTLLRVYQGRIEKGCLYRNARTGTTSRFGRLVHMEADRRTEIASAEAGEIVGVVGLECASGDTFLGDESSLVLESIVVSDPVIELSIEPRRREDASKMSRVLQRFCREDPTFAVMSDETGQTRIAGMGQLHLDVYLQRLEDEFQCPCTVGPPQVAYRSRPTQCVSFEHRLEKQNGGKGMFAHIAGTLEPQPTGSEEGMEFEDATSGGSISPRYLRAVDRGCRNAFAEGPLGGFEVVGVKVTIVDGKEHSHDSSELAFDLCARGAMRDVALPQSQLVLMEPVMQVEIDVPTDCVGQVTGHISSIRGVVNSQSLAESSGGCMKVIAEAPLAELFAYASMLRSMTKGKGTFSMAPCGYRDAPPDVQAAVIQELNAPDRRDRA